MEDVNHLNLTVLLTYVDVKQPWEWKCPLCCSYHCPPVPSSIHWLEGMVSSNTIIASLSHNIPKSIFGHKRLDIW